MIIQTLCYLLHLIGSLQNALQYLQLEEPIESYRNLKPNKFYYRNLNSTKFHRIFLSFSLCPWSVPVWRSQRPNKGFPSRPCCCPLFPIWTFLLIQQILALLMDCPLKISPFPTKTYKVHPFINARFLLISICFPGPQSLLRNTKQT